MIRWLLLLAPLSLAACHDAGPSHVHPNDGAPERPIECSACNPLTQTGCNAGEKCTWVVDSWMPRIGHVGCVGDGSAALGSNCTFVYHPPTGACSDSGLADDCVKGTVCSPLGSDGSGTCKQVCDNEGGNPMCDATHSCVVVTGLFSTGASSPAAAGVCDPACDPLADNDFDGSGSALSRTGMICGSASVGCYGAPSLGTPPATAFSCMPDRNASTPLRHRAECTSANGCIDATGTLYVNSCNQGYEPLLRESTSISMIVCVAFCKPLDCYAGNCGTGDVNRRGAFPHRCQAPDAVGNFGSDEECQYLWRDEIDGSGHWLRSRYSDSVGYCVDRAAYGSPSCASVPLHGSAGSDDAVSLGCVSSTTAGL
jgi:hypothetical protein